MAGIVADLVIHCMTAFTLLRITYTIIRTIQRTYTLLWALTVLKAKADIVMNTWVHTYVGTLRGVAHELKWKI